MIPTKEQVSEKVNQLKDSLHLNGLTPPEGVGELLCLSRTEIKNRTKEELSIDGAVLAQFAIYLKLEANRLRANLSWCEANINSIIGRDLSQTEGYGYPEKSKKIVRADKNAQELEGIRVLCQSQLDTINDLDRKVEFYATSIRNICFIKE